MNWNSLNNLKKGKEPELEFPQFDTDDDLAKHMMKGDTRCDIQINSRVEKINSEVGDRNPNGTIGTVLGNMYLSESRQAYLVLFDQQGEGIAFVIGTKLKYLGMSEYNKVYKGQVGGPEGSRLVATIPIDERVKELVRAAKGLDEINIALISYARELGFVLPDDSSGAQLYIHKEGEFITMYQVDAP